MLNANLLKQIKQITIIVGCQRSGTTLMGHLIGVCENAILLDETDGIYNWFFSAIRDDENANNLLQGVLNKAKNKYKNVQQKVLKESGGKIRLSPEINHLVLKAPNLTFYFNIFPKLSIKTKVIYLVRDARAVVSSMRSLSHIDFAANQYKQICKHPYLAEKFKSEIEILNNQTNPLHIRHAIIWKIKSSLYENFVSLNIPTFLCKYERLVRNPKSTFRLIEDKLGIPFDEIMLQHQSFYQGIAVGKSERTRAIDETSVYKWKSNLTINEQQEIEELVWETAQKLGYVKEFKNSGCDVQVYCVLGMHRSGTSCLTGCLQDLGLHLGSVVNQAPFNKKGNKESLELRAINEEILQFSNGSWDKPPEEITWNNNIKLRRDNLIASHCQNKNWGFKDPRTLFTLPFWLEALPNLKFIGTFRHPLLVARSLSQRDNSSIEMGLELWKKYNLKLLYYAELYKFPIVCYDWPSDVYIHTVSKVAQKIGINNKKLEDSYIDFYEENLRNQNTNSITVPIGEDIMDIYNKLNSLAKPYKIGLEIGT